MTQIPFSYSSTAARAYQSGSATFGSAEQTAFAAPQSVGTDLQDISGTPETSFTDMVAEATQSAIETVRKGDAVGQAGLLGKADPQAVVEATLAMESTLKTVVSVRDKLVTAYQEVLRMPI